MTARTYRGLRLSQESNAAIAQLANHEQRTWSAMARILLAIGIAKRQTPAPAPVQDR